MDLHHYLGLVNNEKYQQTKASVDLTDAEKTTLGNHATWLESIPVKYAGINHWKIPYPDAVLPNYVDPADQD